MKFVYVIAVILFGSSFPAFADTMTVQSQPVTGNASSDGAASTADTSSSGGDYVYHQLLGPETYHAKVILNLPWEGELLKGSMGTETIIPNGTNPDSGGDFPEARTAAVRIFVSNRHDVVLAIGGKLVRFDASGKLISATPYKPEPSENTNLAYFDDDDNINFWVARGFLPNHRPKYDLHVPEANKIIKGKEAEDKANQLRQTKKEKQSSVPFASYFFSSPPIEYSTLINKVTGNVLRLPKEVYKNCGFLELQFLGVDVKGFAYFWSFGGCKGEIVSRDPLTRTFCIFKVSPQGSFESVFDLKPTQHSDDRYAVPSEILAFDDGGAIYQLVNEPSGMEVLRWSPKQ